MFRLLSDLGPVLFALKDFLLFQDIRKINLVTRTCAKFTRSGRWMGPWLLVFCTKNGRKIRTLCLSSLKVAKLRVTLWELGIGSLVILRNLGMIWWSSMVVGNIGRSLLPKTGVVSLCWRARNVGFFVVAATKANSHARVLIVCLIPDKLRCRKNWKVRLTGPPCLRLGGSLLKVRMLGLLLVLQNISARILMLKVMTGKNSRFSGKRRSRKLVCPNCWHAWSVVCFARICIWLDLVREKSDVWMRILGRLGWIWNQTLLFAKPCVTVGSVLLLKLTDGFDGLNCSRMVMLGVILVLLSFCLLFPFTLEDVQGFGVLWKSGLNLRLLMSYKPFRSFVLLVMKPWLCVAMLWNMAFIFMCNMGSLVAVVGMMICREVVLLFLCVRVFLSGRLLRPAALMLKLWGLGLLGGWLLVLMLRLLHTARLRSALCFCKSFVVVKFRFLSLGWFWGISMRFRLVLMLLLCCKD